MQTRCGTMWSRSVCPGDICKGEHAQQSLVPSSLEWNRTHIFRWFALSVCNQTGMYIFKSTVTYCLVWSKYAHRKNVVFLFVIMIDCLQQNADDPFCHKLAIFLKSKKLLLGSIDLGLRNSHTNMAQKTETPNNHSCAYITIIS